MEELKSILLHTTSILPKDFYLSNKRLFEEEHLTLLTNRLLGFHRKQLSFDLPKPYFNEEITPPLEQAYSFFEIPLQNFLKVPSSNEASSLFADAILKADIENVLVVMGQRITPGSIRDGRAIPPLRKTLIESAASLHTEKLTSAAREWSKHTNRSQDKFWGEIKGDDESKNKISIDFVNQILDHSTWWNVFWHYKHEIVFESRLPTGHGARWGKDGLVFIGFLEPFLP